MKMPDGPYNLPKGWRWVRLGEVVHKSQYGYTKSASVEHIGPNSVRMTGITSGRINWEEVPYCECDEITFEDSTQKCVNRLNPKRKRLILPVTKQPYGL